MAEVNILKPGEGIAIFERRKQPRRRVELLFDYSPLVEREDRGGTLADANEEGLQVYLPEKLQIGELFKIKIFAPVNSEVETIQAIAKVVWASRTKGRSGKYRYGLQLQSFYKGDLGKYRALLNGAEQRPEVQFDLSRINRGKD
jgi:hypothetical protein